MSTVSAESHANASCTKWTDMCSADCSQPNLSVSVNEDGHPLGWRLYEHKHVPECIKCKPLVMRDFFTGLMARPAKP